MADAIMLSKEYKHCTIMVTVKIKENMAKEELIQNVLKF